MNDALLNELADAAGIEPHYWDIKGRLHERSPQTARNLLRALGVPADTDAETTTSLAQLKEEQQREVLPPVVVATEGREINILVRLPEKVSPHSLVWSIDFENGGQYRKEFNLQDLSIESGTDVNHPHFILRHFRLPAQPLGYHRLRLEELGVVSSLIVAPTKCYLPPEYLTRRYWGIAAQLYAIRSQKNWGIGDFGDLCALGNWGASRGADTIGINPLHALFLDSPEHASPYSPSSRLFLNPLYLDVTRITDFAESAQSRALAESLAKSGGIQSARQLALVDYSLVSSVKLTVLEQLYKHFRTHHVDKIDDRGSAFRAFVKMKGNELQLFATFQMLSEHFGTHAWTHWPAAYRDPASVEVAELTQSNQQRVSFFEYLQWQCELQVSAAAESVRASGMKLGIYNDLAVGVDASGADHWANQGLFLKDVSVGAPPDPFNEAGQEWGVVPLNPRRLRANQYAHFISLLRASMRHAGALRIDHVMGWQHLYLVPSGSSAAEGAYVQFPLDDMLAIAALESVRNHCIVIGEDLGTIPAGFRERMSNANVLSCRILYFERKLDHFSRPVEIPLLASVSASTHDLATLHGYWIGADISAKTELGIMGSVGDEQNLRLERENDKRLLVQALRDEGLLPVGLEVTNSGITLWKPALGNAVHTYLARSHSLLVMVQLDDLSDERSQANLPGTVLEYPNWRRRLIHSLEELNANSDLRAAMMTITEERRKLT